jgi:ribulose-5-phosphate 4-epimerase/fuculose-1-phosphate aldolase
VRAVTEPTLDAAREAVAAAAQRLAAQGLVLGTAGNLSARVGDLVAVTPTGAVLAELDPDAVVIVDRDGQTVHGDFAPTSEIALHLGAYARNDAGAVVHAHSPVGTRTLDAGQAQEFIDAQLSPLRHAPATRGMTTPAPMPFAAPTPTRSPVAS